ncbi:hypothetical protein [Paraburkholderia sp. PGU19]|nr:hypothetical protein [Paraburkholderia sp. PGU19]
MQHSACWWDCWVLAQAQAHVQAQVLQPPPLRVASTAGHEQR